MPQQPKAGRTRCGAAPHRKDFTVSAASHTIHTPASQRIHPSPPRLGGCKSVRCGAAAHLVPVAYTPLGLISEARPEFIGLDAIKTDPKLGELAHKYGKTRAQIALRYLLKYAESAREAGVYVVSACGYDCMPNDMGTVFLQQQFAEQYAERAREAGVYVVSACGYDCMPNDMGTVFLQQQFAAPAGTTACSTTWAPCSYSCSLQVTTTTEQYAERAREAGVYVVSACGYDCMPNDMGTVFLQQQFAATEQYAERAREAGVYVVSACGYDCMPNDMGTVFLQQQFARSHDNRTVRGARSRGGRVRGQRLRVRLHAQQHGHRTLNSVESYMSSSLPRQYRWEALTQGSVHYGTWNSLIRSFVIHARAGGGWCLPFPGADNSIVYRTQRALHERTGARPAQFRAYIELGAWAILATCGCEYSGHFRKARANMHPQTNLARIVSGVNPGYGATVSALLCAAITILEETAVF
ncbi:putative saccharopine dehydrogenase [Operophtera brumata]|uniref:Putative saccharopine dehydrogenase n=1 Tax=Operophtera brumata TaxID=104452 RepID=A0A0L7L1Z2_OPEBR|nr:putative saccharopine dehydrogenase [Operophtera brumata]